MHQIHKRAIRIYEQVEYKSSARTLNKRGFTEISGSGILYFFAA